MTHHAMNPVVQKIEKRLNSLPPALQPLAKMALRYSQYCSTVAIDDTALIAHKPWQAPEAYTFRLFPPAKEAWFSKYGKIHQVKVPTSYREILRHVNGCFAFGFSLYGIPPSMLQDPPLLNRTELQCFDIATANNFWRHKYKVAQSAFYFGGREYSDNENSGYFLLGKSVIIGVLQNGTLVGQWNNFTAFLTDELAAAEKRECAKIPKDWRH